MPEGFPSVRDALIILGLTVAVYVALIALAQVLRRTRKLRFGWSYHCFAVAAGLLAAVRLSAWRPLWFDELVQHLAAVVILCAAFPVIHLINRAAWRRTLPDGTRTEAPRLLADATGIVVFLLIALAVVQFIYGVPVPGLLAGSGIVGIVLGLAMQDLLGNVIGGFALYLERPFKAGDWLLVDGHHAKVVEVNWRATRLLTVDDVFLDVPNSHLVGEAITNFHQPDPVHAVRTTIMLSDDVPPARAQEVLLAAAQRVPGTCAKQPPEVFAREYVDDAVTYEIKVWIDDHAKFERVLSDVRTHAWYAVTRAGFLFPYGETMLLRSRQAIEQAAARAAAATALRGHDIFSALTPEQIEALVAPGVLMRFAPHEQLVTQGAPTGAMYLIVRGNVEVRRTRDGQPAMTIPLGPGSCAGEMALLTGDPRVASVVAVTEVEAVEISPEAFAAVLRAHPGVVGRLSELVAERQLANERHDAQVVAPARVAEVRATALQKLKRFFSLDG